MSTNVLLNDFSMNSFSSRTCSSSGVPCRQVNQGTLSIEDRNRFQLIIGIVFCVMGLAILFAPEKPQQFESICEKYNTANACQVW